MIIRRRHTKSFVTLENQLVRDRRLSLDEHGMLHYLLSLPDDWEVSRANCARFWDIGRDKAARIFRSLRKFGWAQIERVHGDDGTFLGVRWIITDEPGAEVPDDVLDQEVAEKEMPGRGAGMPEEDDAPSNHDTENPCDGLPVVRVTRSTEKAYHGDYIESTKTESEENRLPQNGVGEKSLEASEGTTLPTFTEMAREWPPDHVLSRVAAEQAWQRLARLARHQAFNVAPRYLEDCRRSSRKVCDLTTYIREARFERFADARNDGKTFVAKPGTPQWHRWHGYLKAMGKPVNFMEAQSVRGIGWTTNQEWPPPLPPELVRPGDDTADTGPPSADRLMSEQDEKDLADFR